MLLYNYGKPFYGTVGYEKSDLYSIGSNEPGDV